MKALHVETIDASRTRSTPDVGVRPRRTAQPTSPIKKWRRRSETWGSLMVAAQGGKERAYAQLLRELDLWLRRYYARRLPPAAADDARQDTLLAIHAKRQTYIPSMPFGPWAAAIARYKWIDYVRDASRFDTVSLSDETPIEDNGAAAISTVELEALLSRLKPAQARVIRLVKLDGASIADASSATGQSRSLVKVNIHRGLKKLVALATDGATTPRASGRASGIRRTEAPNIRARWIGGSGSDP